MLWWCADDSDSYYIKKEDEPLDVDLIFRIAGLGIVVAVLNQLLIRAGREEQALLTTIAGLVVVLLIISQEIGELFESIKRIFDL